MAFAHQHGVDLQRSMFLGTSATHRRLATTLGASYTELEERSSR